MKAKLFFLGMLSALIASSGLQAQTPTPDTAPEGVKIAQVADIENIIREGGVIYDVRWHYSEYVFEGHIPTAVSVPFTEWSKKSVDYTAAEDHWDYSTLPADKNTPVAFYCMGLNCWKSYKVSEQVAKMGYKNVYWYKGGQPEWDKLGLPAESRHPSFEAIVGTFTGKNNPHAWSIEPEVMAEMYVSGQEFQVIDLRYGSFFEEGRLKGAFQVALKDLFSRDGIQLLPQPKEGITIVLVSENGQTAFASATALALLGYEVKVLNGGMKAWYQKYNDNKWIEKGKHAVNTPGGSSWKGQLHKLPKGPDA